MRTKPAPASKKDESKPAPSMADAIGTLVRGGGPRSVEGRGKTEGREPARGPAPRIDPRRRGCVADRRRGRPRPPRGHRDPERSGRPSRPGPPPHRRTDRPRASRAAQELRRLHHARRPPGPDRPDPGRPDLLQRRDEPGHHPAAPPERLPRRVRWDRRQRGHRRRQRRIGRYPGADRVRIRSTAGSSSRSACSWCSWSPCEIRWPASTWWRP